jgi:hypothetical protein
MANEIAQIPTLTCHKGNLSMWTFNLAGSMHVSLAKQQGRAAHNTKKARTTHNAKGGLRGGLCYGRQEGCAMCAISIFIAPYFFILQFSIPMLTQYKVVVFLYVSRKTISNNLDCYIGAY